MLRAYRSDYAQPQAPKVYEDPDRIAALLVPARPGPGRRAPEAAAAQPNGAAQRGRPGRTGPRPRRRPRAGRGPAPPCIRERDLDRNNPAGQALPQGAVRPSAGMRQAPRRAAAACASGTGRSRPSRRCRRRTPTSRTTAASPRRSSRRRPGGVYYRPGIQSTGRLDLRIAPDRPAGGGAARRAERQGSARG